MISNNDTQQASPTASPNCPPPTTSESSTTEKHTTIERETITIRPSATNTEKSYTIVVPANVRIRGVDMQLDLKIDQKTLAAASDISRAINEVVSSVSSLPADSGRQAILRIPSLNSDLNFTIAPDTPEGSSRGTASISLPSSANSDLEAQSRQVSSTSQNNLMDDATGEDPKSHVVSSTTEPSPMEVCTESGNIDDVQPCHGPTSTTEPMEQDTDADDLVVSSSDNLAEQEHLPNTSTPDPGNEPLSKISVGTSFPETSVTMAETTTFASREKEPEMFTKLPDSPPLTSEVPETPENTQHGPEKEDTPMFMTLPHTSAASVQSQLVDNQDSNMSAAMEDGNVDDHDHDVNESFGDHESQPTTSSAAPTPVPNAPTPTNAPKKKKGKSQAQSIVCEYVDKEKGQCKQHALVEFRYCIRHILLDPTAPYKQCQHLIKPKHKKDEWTLCTNPVKTSTQDIYCTTHLIKLGKKEPKKKKAPAKPDEGDQAPGSVDQTQQMYPNPYSSEQFGPGSYQNPYNGEWSTGGDSSSSYPMHPPSAGAAAQQNTSAMYNHPHQMMDGRYTPHNTSGPYEPDHYGHGQYANGAPGMSSMDSPAASHTAFQHPAPSPSTGHQSGPQFAMPTHAPPIRRPSAPVPFANQGAGSSSDGRGRAASVSAQPGAQGPQGAAPKISHLSKQHPQLAAKLLQGPITQRTENSSGGGHPQDPSGAVAYTNQSGVMNPMMAPLTRMSAPLPPGQTPLPQAPAIVRTVYNNPPPLPPTAVAPMVPSVPIAPAEPQLNSAAPLPMLNLECRPIHYCTDGLEGMDELTEHLKIQRDYLSDASSREKKRSSISLHQKRQKIRMSGQFRSIPPIKNMCRVIEDYDFDRTDLFPLGLEPSDDEESSDDTMHAFGDWHSGYNDWGQPKTQMELYLLKKQLRLEKKRLHKHAHMTLPVIFAAKYYPNSAGAALRARLLQWRRQSFKNVVPGREKRCSHMAQVENREVQCENPSLPFTNHCSDHIGYNVDQKMYRYCNIAVCGRPVLYVEAYVTGGLCVAHYEQQKAATEKKKHVEMPPPPHQPSHVGMTSAPRYPSVVGIGPHGSSVPQHYSNVMRQPVMGPPPMPPPHGYGYPSVHDPHMMSNGHAENSNDNSNVVEGDVSLASVANDLGFDERGLNAMLAELPIGDDALENNPISVGDGFLGEQDIGHDLDHNWADIESFLLSEGYSPAAALTSNSPGGGPSSHSMTELTPMAPSSNYSNLGYDSVNSGYGDMR